MNHFLSSLPEEVTEFVDVSDEFSAPYIPKQPTDSSAANLSLPIFSNRALKHSQSFENFESSSRLLQEDADNSQFSDMPRSRLVH